MSKKNQSMQHGSAEKAIVYVRVSTEEQTKGYSLQTQEERCREYAEGRGYEVVERFLDSQSGEDLNRPDLNRMFRYVIEHPVQVLVVYDTDRLSRGGPYQHGTIEHLLKKSNVRIEYVRGDFNEASPESQFSKMIQQTISWYENQQRRERVLRGRLAKARAGKVVAAPTAPLGYAYQKGDMVIDEGEAALVRRVFRLYLEGWSFKKIAMQFIAEGIPTKRDGPTTAKAAPTSRTMWFPSTISRILHNRTYTGVWHYNKSVVTKENGKRKHRERAGSEWLPVPVPAIIDQDTYDQAQAIMQRNKILAKRNTKHEYLLRGILQCSCGYICHASTRSRRAAYRCPGTKLIPNRPACEVNFYKYAEEVDAAVWQSIIGILLDEDNLRQAIGAQREQAQASTRPLSEKLEALQHTRADLEAKLQSLIDVFLDGTMPRSIVEERKRLLAANLAALEDEEKRVRGEMAAISLSPQAEESLLEVAKTIRQGASLLSFEERRRIVMLLQVKVLALSKTQLKISCLLPMAKEVVDLELGNHGSKDGSRTKNGQAPTAGVASSMEPQHSTARANLGPSGLPQVDAGAPCEAEETHVPIVNTTS